MMCRFYVVVEKKTELMYIYIYDTGGYETMIQKYGMKIFPMKGVLCHPQNNSGAS